MSKLVIAIFIVVFSFDAFAISEQEQSNSIDDQNRLIQRQQQIEQEQLRQKELQQIEKERQKIDLEESEEKDLEELPSFADIRCFRIEKAIFSENTILSKFREKKLSQDFLGQCLTISQINKLAKKISNYLIEIGYVTSRVQLLPQNLSDGILEIKIIESALEDIKFNEENFFDKTQKFTAFGFVPEDEILNIRRIEQGLEQINRLESNGAQIKILPGENRNSSIIAVENHPNLSFRPNISFDNSGSKITGKRRDIIGFTQDNFLRLNDNFTFSRTANDLDGNKENKGTKAISSSFSIPFSWYTLTFNYSRSSYQFSSGSISPFKSLGRTSTKSVTLDRILIKEKKFKLASNFTLTSKYNQSFIDETKVEVSSKKSSTASIGLSSTYFFDKATLFLKPNYVQSLKILDARKNADNLASNSAHAQFEMFKFYGNYAQRSQILQTPISYNLTFDSQVSKQKLYSVDQFYVGGVYSVRGFSEGSISGDSGYTMKNEINVNLGQAIIPYVSSEKISQKLLYLRYFSLTPFYDYGYIRQKGGQESGRLTGGGIKLGFNHKNFSAYLTFSRVISKSHLLNEDYNENRAIYFTINSQVGFF
jgi:hemolysin activation/secretion protein